MPSYFNDINNDVETTATFSFYFIRHVSWKQRHNQEENYWLSNFYIIFMRIIIPMFVLTYLRAKKQIHYWLFKAILSKKQWINLLI